jgi:OmpA-OmpF porin, OOP family
MPYFIDLKPIFINMLKKTIIFFGFKQSSVIFAQYILKLKKRYTTTKSKHLFMASKKYSFLLGALSLVTISASQAQTGSSTVYRGSGYDVNDTALIPAKRMDQQRDFLNRNYDYPAKPRNQWELNIGFGALNVSGDVRSKSFYNRPLEGNALNTMAWHVAVRKAWGYVISTRLQYMHGAAHGYNWQASQGYSSHAANPYQIAYNTPGAAAPTEVNYAYKTKVRSLTLDMLASLNNIKFHKARNKMSVYGIFGIGGLLYSAQNDLKDANNANYNYAANNLTVHQGGTPNPAWVNNYRSNRVETEKDLQDMFDGKFETAAERHDNRYWMGKYTFRPVATTGMGIQFRPGGSLGRRISIGIEDKVTFTNDDLVDGQRWQEWPAPNFGGSAATRDFDNINYLNLNLGINLGAKAVAPLWWLNPMDFAYNELTTGRRQGAKAAITDCSTDTDGDGVSDCFDKCNDTPLGVAVDSKGCALDTDGDGVPDFKDRELITPTKCQPVDADGIGNCPCDPKCVTKVEGGGGCGSINSGNIQFTNGSTKLSGSAMSSLNNLANKMRENPSCKVVMNGNGTSKLEQQRSWARVKQCIDYMQSQGIDRDRFCFEFGQIGTPNSVDYMTTTNSCGGGDPIPPHPNLK